MELSTEDLAEKLSVARQSEDWSLKAIN